VIVSAAANCAAVSVCAVFSSKNGKLQFKLIEQ
jgi:hypothetical protein